MTDTKFDEKFIQEVIDRYSKYIEIRCKATAGKQIKDPAWGYEDIQQEIYIHIWRFCTKASQKFSSPDKIWLPHMETILRNVIVNLIEGYGKFKRSDNLCDYTKDLDIQEQMDKTFSDRPHEMVELSNFLAEAKKKIRPEYENYFDEIINPSEKFRNFIRENTPEGRTVKLTKTMVSKYFRISYNKALTIFKEIESSIDSCNSIA